MQDQPNIENLLRVARRSVLDSFVDRLPNELRLDALIVANIMAIAAREAEYGETPLREELMRLATLYGEAPPPVPPVVLPAAPPVAAVPPSSGGAPRPLPDEERSSPVAQAPTASNASPLPVSTLRLGRPIALRPWIRGAGCSTARQSNVRRRAHKVKGKPSQR